MKFKTLLAIISFVLLCFGCDKDHEGQQNCDQQIIISGYMFETAPLDEVAINDMEIDGNCLKISFSASGSDGSTWIVKLIDSGTTLESYPPQKRLILSLENKELCEAVIGNEMSFNIEELQVSRSPVRLNITNTGDGILYEY